MKKILLDTSSKTYTYIRIIMSFLFDYGSVNSGFSAFLTSNYGFVGPDWTTGGFKVESQGPLVIESTGGDISINPTDGSAVNIGTQDYDSEINIGTSGARYITIGSTDADVLTTGEVIHVDGKILRQFNPLTLTGNAEILTVDDMLLPTPAFTGNAAGVGTGLTLPDAADIVADIDRAAVNEFIGFTVINTNGAANSFTVTMGLNGTAVGGMTVAASSSAYFALRLTSVTTGAETYSVYRMSP